MVLAAYICIFDVQKYELPLYVAAPIACISLYGTGDLIQRVIINRVIARSTLISLTLTFGLELIVNNLLINQVSATPRSLVTNFGAIEIFAVRLPLVRVGGMVVALVPTGLLYWLLRHSQLGRAIIAVRMDRFAAVLMEIKVKQIYAITLGIGAFMAAAAGCALALIYPISPLTSGLFLGKAFVICVLGGLGSVPAPSWVALRLASWRAQCPSCWARNGHHPSTFF